MYLVGLYTVMYLVGLYTIMYLVGLYTIMYLVGLYTIMYLVGLIAKMIKSTITIFRFSELYIWPEGCCLHMFCSIMH